MAANRTQPWYVGKRAEAYVYSLLADRDVVVRTREDQDFGADLVLDLRKEDREQGRYLAVQLVGCLEFPRKTILAKEIAAKIPASVRDELILPLVVFVVQVKELAALYAWLNEPVVQDGEAILRSPTQLDWRELDEGAVDDILKRVDTYWEQLLKQVRK
jgi:hypothetical protein